MTTVTSGNRKCSSCGDEIAPDAPAGLCLRCLLRLGTQSGQPGDADPLPAPDEAGRQFGDYELLEQLARGGMGVVYKARQLKLGRIVALKVILSGEFANDMERKRFQFEAESAASLDHPNIVLIHEIGEHEGRHFFSMKLIEGGNLQQKRTEFEIPRFEAGKSLDRSAMRERQVKIARLLSKLARAVDHAHKCGILHRDLKPSNILIDAGGEPHVTDFGLAKRIVGDQSITLSQSVLGSPCYMAPEQAAGRSPPVTTAADTFSLGVILYELLTGRLPFKGDNPLATLKLIAESQQTCPRALNPALSRDLETICLKCLEKDPARRYASAEALSDDLERWIEKRPILARRSAPLEIAWKWIKREPIKTALACAILLAVIGPCIVAFYYIKRLPYLASVHPAVSHDLQGAYSLPIWDGSGDRCTLNFWRGNYYLTTPALMRLELANVPPELAATLRFVVRSDQPGRPDPARSPELTNQQAFRMDFQMNSLDRGFYFAEVGFAASNVLALASNAIVQLRPVK